MARKKHKPIHKSFQYRVIDFNAKTKEYTLKNIATGHTRVMPQDQFLELSKEQGEN